MPELGEQCNNHSSEYRAGKVLESKVLEVKEQILPNKTRGSWVELESCIFVKISVETDIVFVRVYLKIKNKLN